MVQQVNSERKVNVGKNTRGINFTFVKRERVGSTVKVNTEEKQYIPPLAVIDRCRTICPDPDRWKSAAPPDKNKQAPGTP